MIVRIQSLINELHHKTARYLVDNFDVILLPAFETSDMVARGQRRIRSKTVRNLLSFAHHRFRNFLKHKASRERQDTTDSQRGIHLKDSELDRGGKPQAGRKKDSEILRRTEDRPRPQRRPWDIPAGFGEIPPR